MADSTKACMHQSGTLTSKVNIASIFALRPIQKALLLHRDPTSGSDPGLILVRFTLTGMVDPIALERAWHAVLQANVAMRMSLHPIEGRDPRIVVWRQTALPWITLDWQGASASEQHRRMGELLDEERRRGLDLRVPPAMRVALVRLAPRRQVVVWTCHHLFLDGWSAGVVIQQVLEHYWARFDPHGPVPAASPLSYADYLGWLKRQPQDRAEEFWSRKLAGLRCPPPIRLVASGASPMTNRAPSIDTTLALDQTLSDQVERFCSGRHLTGNALFQGVWALLLRHLSGRDDIVFGTTVSGRTAELAGIESLVGMFSNVVPIRVSVEADRPVADLLRQIRDELFDVQAFEHSTMAEIQSYSDVPGGRPLFESLVVVQNLSWWKAAAKGGELQLADVASGITSTFPLTLYCSKKGSWQIELRYDQGRFDEQGIAGLLKDCGLLLQAIISQPTLSVAGLLSSLQLESAASPTALPPPVPPPSRATGSGLEPDRLLPRNPTELRLTGIWEQILGVHPIGIHDDFFALGGSSFVAVRLFDRIADAFGRELPLALLLQSPTIENLASVLDENSRPSWRCLVPIQSGGDKPPLICAHAGGGHVLFYRDLARHLGSDRPVYGVQPVGLEGEQPPMQCLEEMAKQYVAELETVQPSGPYLLAGHCAGATVCLAMASLLEARGQTVALIVVLDSGPPPLIKTTGIAKLRGLRWNWGSSVRGWAYRRIYRPLVLNYGSAARRRKVHHNLVEEAGWRAFGNYLPKRCNAPITLIRSIDFAASRDKDYHLDWQYLGASLTIEQSAAHHETMMLDPEVADVARLVTHAIDRAMDSRRTLQDTCVPVISEPSLSGFSVFT